MFVIILWLDDLPCNETVDHDLALLTDSVSSGEGLDIVVGIPIRIIDDDSVGGSKIDTKTSSPKRNKSLTSVAR